MREREVLSSQTGVKPPKKRRFYSVVARVCLNMLNMLNMLNTLNMLNMLHVVHAVKVLYKPATRQRRCKKNLMRLRLTWREELNAPPSPESMTSKAFARAIRPTLPMIALKTGRSSLELVGEVQLLPHSRGLWPEKCNSYRTI